MINLEEHKDFEELYFKHVYEKKFESQENKTDNLINQLKAFFPPQFFKNCNTYKDCCRKLILANYSQLETVVKYLNNNKLNYMTKIYEVNNGTFEMNKGNYVRTDYYQKIFKYYESIFANSKESPKMSIQLTRSLNLTVCPYCNRDYINSRGDNKSGAELDHFFPRSKYPFFSISLYNLIPVCGNCNRIKSDSSKMASPFDNSILWSNDVKFEYCYKSNEIEISSKHKNITDLILKEAYQIHCDYAKSLKEKSEEFTNTQIDEFIEVLNPNNENKTNIINLSPEKIKSSLFGEKISDDDLKNISLGKLTQDLHKQFGIYP